MRQFFSNRVRVVLIIAVLLTVVLAVVSSLTGMSIPDMAVKGILTPIRTGVSRLTDQAEQLYNYMFEYESLAAENAALKESLAKMEEDAREADSVARENDRLRALLGLKEAHEDYEGNCNSLQYSCQENSMDRGAWGVTVHVVIKS